MGNSTDNLTERETQILETVLAHYIRTGEPVGSRTVAKLSGLNLSPATIRNSMQELEERGFLKQPHTSAGRVPTDKGYRYFVERLMRESQLAPDEQRTIRHQFHQVGIDLDADPRRLEPPLDRLEVLP